MKKNEYFLYVTIFVLWIIIAVFTGISHEPWADEAQSWLIARDNSYFDIVTKYLRYEGHPALFYFILRFVHQLHFSYDFLFLVPLIFSGIGVFLLLFKTKAPTLIKSIVPFTFFIIYQYGIIARSYCLIFPILMFITVIYKNRINKIIPYSVALILLMSISAYNYITAFVLFSFLVFDVIKNKSINKKTICSISSVILFFILTAIYIWTPHDCISWEPFVFSVKKVCNIITNSYFNPIKEIDISAIITVCIFYISAMLAFCKNKYQYLFFILINTATILGLSITDFRCWHYGIVYITILFSIVILYEENKANNNSKSINILFYTLFIFLSLIQISWSIKAILSDLHNEYCSSKSIYTFIKNNNFNSLDMIGLGYRSVAMQPYFRANKYKNYKTTHYQFSSSFFKYSDEHATKRVPIIIYDPSWERRYTDILNNIKDEYYSYPFYGSFCCNGKTKKSIDLYVLIKKDFIKR